MTGAGTVGHLTTHGPHLAAVASTDSRTALLIWALDERRLVSDVDLGSSTSTSSMSVAASEGGVWIAAHTRLLRVRPGELSAPRVDLPSDRALGPVAASPDGRRLAVGLGEQVLVWAAEEPFRTLRGATHRDHVRGVCVADDGTCASGDWTGQVLLWSPEGTLVARRDVPGATGHIWMTPDRSRLLAGTDDGVVVLEAGPGLPESNQFTSFRGPTPAANFRSGASLKTSSNAAKISAGASGQFGAAGTVVTAVVFDDAGASALAAHVVAGRAESELRLWGVADGTPLRRFPLDVRVTSLVRAGGGVVGGGWPGGVFRLEEEPGLFTPSARSARGPVVRRRRGVSE